MLLNEFLEETANLTGDTKVYISCNNVDYIVSYANEHGFDKLRKECLDKVSASVDRFAVWCDIIWEFNYSPENYRQIGTATLHSIRGHSFDTDKNARMLSSTDDNASGFYSIDGFLLLKNVDFGKDVVVLYL